jgi:prepilin-type N-terminal cleavage/methylation domain-containing protein
MAEFRQSQRHRGRPRPQPRGQGAGFQGGVSQRGFSLIELLTAVSIMVLIIFALYQMFAQTQKALRANITQVDVLESGRATAEMMGRELEQLAACNLPQTINLSVTMQRINNTVVPPLLQTDLDGVTVLRANLLQEIFFLTRETNRWLGTGYRVIDATNGIGTLYRFSISTNYLALNYTNLIEAFVNATLTNRLTGQLSTNFSRVTDGVIHLRLTAFDPEGRRMDAIGTNVYPTYCILRRDGNGTPLIAFGSAKDESDPSINVRLRRQVVWDSLRRQQVQATQFSFERDALPGCVELELGVLEPATLKQYQSLAPSPAAAAAFLQKQAAKVHLFRQRIPIRTVQQ